MGESACIKFWHDIWYGYQSLKETLPELFRIACYWEASMADHLQYRNGTIHWDLNFIRTMQDLELKSLSSFIDLISGW